MKLLAWFWLMLLQIAGLFLAPILVLFALPFAKPDNKINCLPGWLQWLNTWDDPGCNQGMYEPQVASKMKYGWYVKTWYWLGWRNQFYGLFHNMVSILSCSITELFPSTSPFNPGVRFVTDDGYWEFLAVWPWSSTKCAKVWIGWKLYPIQGKTDVVLPVFQIKPLLTKN